MAALGAGDNRSLNSGVTGFHPTEPVARPTGKVGYGALRTVPAVATERPLWVSKSGPLPLMIGPRRLLDQALTRDRWRKMKRDPQTGRVVRHFDMGAVQFGDSRYEAEAEAVARAVAAVLEAIKAPQHVAAFGARDPGSAVGDRQHRTIGARRDADRHLARTAAVLDRVVDEIGQGVE